MMAVLMVAKALLKTKLRLRNTAGTCGCASVKTQALLGEGFGCAAGVQFAG